MKLSWDSDACTHSGNCVKGLPQVFKVEDGKFVIDETGAPDEEIKRAVANCPSGAIKAAG